MSVRLVDLQFSSYCLFPCLFFTQLSVPYLKQGVEIFQLLLQNCLFLLSFLLVFALCNCRLYCYMYMFIIAIFLEKMTLFSIYNALFVSEIIFDLSIFLSDTSLAIPAHFWFLFTWNLFPSFHLQLSCVFGSKMSLPYKAYSWIVGCFFFLPFCQSLTFVQCFNPFTFKNNYF